MKRTLNVWILGAAWIFVACWLAVILWSELDEVPRSAAHDITSYTDYILTGSLAIGLALISYGLACHFLGRATSESSFYSMVYLGIGLVVAISAARRPYGLSTVLGCLAAVGMIYQFIAVRRGMAATKNPNVDGT